jgi:hypothetical protein
MNRVISGVGRDVARLGPAIYQPDQPISDNNSQIEVSARAWGGALYVFAVNSGWTATNATIKVPTLGGRPLTAMGEGRRVNSDDDTFTDHFAPMAVHLYIAAPAGP